MIFKWFWVTLSPLIHEPYRMKMNVIYFWSLKLVEDLNSVYHSYDTTRVQQNISNCSRLTYVSMYQSSRDKFDGTQLYSTLALWLLWSLARSICSKGEQKGSTSGAHNGGVVAMAAAAAFSLEEGSQGKQGMARQEKAWHGGQFWWDTVSWMELARFSFFSTGGVKSHSFIAQLNCKWFHELLLLLFTVV